MNRANHIFDLIGNTPIVKINNINPYSNVEIYAKLEWFNPMGSLKDRVALPVIETAEREGNLTKDKKIVEATSGNTGISVAWVARLKGYECIIVMPEYASVERKKMLRALGVNLILVPTEAEAINKAMEIAKNPRYFMINQFNNENNWKAHYHTTGEEIWKQTNGQITHFVAGIGTSGTLMGVGRRLRQYNKSVQIIGVEPSSSEHKQEGLVNFDELRPGIYNPEDVDEIIIVRDEDAFITARNLFLNEGLFVGISSGSTMYAAISKARELKEGLIVTLFGDHGFKYLSTELFWSKNQ